MPRQGDGLAARALARLEEVTGYSVLPEDQLSYLREAETDARLLRRERDQLGYAILNAETGRPQDLKPEERKTLVHKAWNVWRRDPQAGNAVDLVNDFTLGRGIPKPKAKDEEVQKVIDDFWDDPENKAILTTHAAQLAFNTDLSLQSNVFVLVYDDGEDGKVKLSVLEHDAVEDVIPDTEDNRFVPLFYKASKLERVYDFDRDVWDTPPNAKKTTLYYEHWANVKRYREEGRDLPTIPPKKQGEGRVYHLAENKGLEMAFGHPRFDRTLRWYTAYNRFMEARVDMMAAAAAFVMKRKSQGTQGQLERMATKTMSRRSPLGSAQTDPVHGSLPNDDAVGPWRRGPGSAAVLSENDTATHEPFNLTTNASNAAEDARMLGAQISSGTGFPRSYFGDPGASSLATATSLELPVLKRIESRQELIEGLVRWAVDLAIQRAVDTGRLDKALTPDELAQRREDDAKQAAPAGAQPGTPPTGDTPPVELQQAHEGKQEDEEDTERDLGYEFKMPNPLRRLMGDLVTAVMQIAQTFDPNGTNVELSRILLQVALAEALELPEAADLVERVFPPGYVDPALQGMGGPPAGPPGADPNDFGPFGPGGSPGPDGQNHTEDNPYGAPQTAQPPEQAMEADVLGFVARWPRGRDGSPLPAAEVRRLVEANRRDAAPAQRRAQARTTAEGFAGMEPLVLEVLEDVERAHRDASGNGNGNGRG